MIGASIGSDGSPRRANPRFRSRARHGKSEAKILGWHKVSECFRILMNKFQNGHIPASAAIRSVSCASRRGSSVVPLALTIATHHRFEQSLSRKNFFRTCLEYNAPPFPCAHIRFKRLVDSALPWPNQNSRSQRAQIICVRMLRRRSRAHRPRRARRLARLRTRAVASGWLFLRVSTASSFAACEMYFDAISWSATTAQSSVI